MNLSTVERYHDTNIWNEYMADARGALEAELASVLAWRRVCETRADLEGMIEDRRKELGKLQKRLPGLQSKRDEMRVVCDQATNRYNARMSRDPETARGSAADKGQRQAAAEAQEANRAYRRVWDRVQVLERELETIEPVYSRVEAIPEPETPLLEELNLV